MAEKKFLQIGDDFINPDMVVAVTKDGDLLKIHLSSVGTESSELHRRFSRRGEDAGKVWNYFQTQAQVIPSAGETDPAISVI